MTKRDMTDAQIRDLETGSKLFNGAVGIGGTLVIMGFFLMTATTVLVTILGSVVLATIGQLNPVGFLVLIVIGAIAGLFMNVVACGLAFADSKGLIPVKEACIDDI